MIEISIKCHNAKVHHNVIEDDLEQKEVAMVLYQLEQIKKELLDIRFWEEK